MEDKKVVITNLVDATVGINIPELRLNRTWEKKGAKKMIPFSVLQEAIYDNGTEYLFKQKILYIEDKEVRIELGLEEPDSKEELLLNEKQMKRYLTVLPLNELKEAIKTMGQGPLQSLIQYAVDNEIVNIERCDLIKKITGKDIIAMIQFKRSEQEG